jgi:hypothetical protein
MTVNDFGADLTHIAIFLASISLVTLLLKNPQGTVQVINSVTSGYNGLLQTLTLQNNYGNSFQG